MRDAPWDTPNIMNDVFLVEFDVKSGPQIKKSLGESNLSEEEEISLKFCSLPESATRGNENPLFFVFKVSDRFCYALYNLFPDNQSPRGHKQFSYVIMTSNKYYTPYLQFLLSTKALKQMNPLDVVDLIFDFLSKWDKVIPKVSQGKVELPTFIGSFPVSKMNKKTELFDDLDRYLFNDSFLDVDLCQSLCFHSLRKTSRTGDILSLWEASVLDESVLVYGSSASNASNASLVIGSLRFPGKLRENLFPYLSISDPNFRKSKSSSIVGVSNPIVLNNSTKFKHIFKVGFEEEENGLGGGKFSWEHLEQFDNINSKTIRKILCVNTFHAMKAIKHEFILVLNENPYFALNSKLNAERIEIFLFEENVQMMRSSIDFSKQLLQSSFTKEYCLKLCKNDLVIQSLQKFNISNYCSTFEETKIIDFYSLINETIKLFNENENGNEVIISIMRTHLNDLKILLSPDLAHV